MQVPLESVEDARRCVKYLQEKADDLGLDREKIVLAGERFTHSYSSRKMQNFARKIELIMKGGCAL